MICNYQNSVRDRRQKILVDESICEACGTTLQELQTVGQALEICGAEHYSNPVSGERFLVPVALCPACHLENHREASGRLNPCNFAAEGTWKAFDREHSQARNKAVFLRCPEEVSA